MACGPRRGAGIGGDTVECVVVRPVLEHPDGAPPAVKPTMNIDPLAHHNPIERCRSVCGIRLAAG
ncbi:MULTISPECIES: hypothetical protein [unclassified Rhodococcus (in: high G+C Gram-positive bacteria)]|uniref:hypothetical protein n=1 Tax=unclassified Rhodococcus (in: high G+C Gram-positive bacteria) TaxID=192944 RepID=UPI0002FB71D0|nr:hypothetical protein [Rhodococcus sp. DK17]